MCSKLSSSVTAARAESSASKTESSSLRVQLSKVTSELGRLHAKRDKEMREGNSGAQGIARAEAERDAMER